MNMIVLLLAALYAGRPLVDAIHDLEARGLRIIYSDDVVTSRMMVKQEPRATEPRKILDEILAPHNLRAVPGPQDTLLIVRDEAEEKKAAMPVTLAEIDVHPRHDRERRDVAAERARGRRRRSVGPGRRSRGL
jgi:hypothetical protein